MNDDNIIIHSTLEQGYDFYITDKWHKKYHFKISTFAVPSGFLSEAIEVINPNSESVSRTFQILSDFEADIETSELVLKAKIKEGINQKHLEIEDGQLRIGDEQILIGKISCEDDAIETTLFEIDGKRITVEKFVDMLQMYSGWKFKFQIFDSTDELE